MAHEPFSPNFQKTAQPSPAKDKDYEKAKGQEGSEDAGQSRTSPDAAAASAPVSSRGWRLMQLAYALYIVGLLAVVLTAVGGPLALWRAVMALPALPRTAAAMTANAALSTLFVTASGIPDPWFVYIALDAGAAAIVLHQPAGRPQSIIGGIYMAQITISCVYGVLDLAGRALGENGYWQALISLAFAQLVVLGSWIGGHYWRRRSRHSRVRRRSPVALRKSGEGLEK